MVKNKSIRDLILEYFKRYPKQDLKHGPVVDWVEEQYIKLYKRKPRDIWRAIRNLHEEGILIKVKKGVHRYDPDLIKEIELFDFPPDIKEKILELDNYKCVVCGRGIADGVELCADHIKAKGKGGDNSIDNGQTLCMEHNLLKKNYSRTEAGKRYFIKIYKQAVAKGDEKMIKFCKEVFDAYDKHRINGHIKRPNGR
ncbi:MAG: HNH endonuclease [Candidatus Schekmanbacteria bacterium RIFCSPHIGHO2_02_FULL_38_11]|uniref:HNH endonuclease n=1 Tax=Candidatus Schekmanbacteria bacterium RIFCSPLOWO2_12_FULL_38_15 TaxID=1817883 RepID=A0A1F7SCZ2_9BACT|nr:MAG: HNH endonuclease [Candidatus Schekmanbacteria bacterium GWA2_38_9]OGL48771.1 MAG: HNH endonuclease [Candidatus Schekmanbacteria bacterium RIFCSPLOWO2_02_FULL_38_14]OGL51642.1 MAG: HNH endonuclease [Candidatus Schekmanbacteria bacterium RIFCSPLOWO2_12_FULL_38_15]OGL53117.1 MAG: HNH endonuclease [Candidatus Schekmanbacteria bacterium RIFCSPHIGHO2_02_FULL_38_11]